MKNYFFHIFLIALLFLSQACKEKTDPTSEDTKVKQELKIILTNPVETLDPLEILYSDDWKVSSNIFESIVSLNENDKVVPELAVSYSISKDRIQYTFKIRDSVFFHDSPCFPNGKGRKLNAYDIKYTFERLADKENSFSNFPMINQIIYGINDFHKGKEKFIKGIDVQDSLSISFTLVKPFAPFLILLTSPNFYIVPREAVEYFGKDFKYHPVGTGPFRISEYRKFEKVHLVKNEHYYLKDKNNISLPYLNSICYSTIKESEKVFTELLNKTTDIIDINKKEYNNIQKQNLIANNYRVIKINKGNGFRYLGFNFKNNRNERTYKLLRTAIVKSYNRNLITNKINQFNLAESIVPQYLLGDRTVKWFSYGELYSQKFNKNIFSKDTLIIMSNINALDFIELEKTLQRLHIPFKRIIKPENYYENIKLLKPDVFRVSMIPAYPHPVEYYSLFYSKNSKDINLGGFSNKTYDKLFEKTLFEINDSVLTDYYIQLDKILKDEIAAIYLTHNGPRYYIYQKNLKGIVFKYISLDFRKAYFE